MENNYQPNSHRFKEEQKELPEKKKVEKVVTGSVKTKKNEIRKLTDIFISEDAANVKSYIVMDVLIPAIKNTILDIIVDSAKMIFGGGRDRRSSTADKVSYGKMYNSGSNSRRVSTAQSSTIYSYDDIVLDSRPEAEEVLSRMDELLESYGLVSVADLYDLVGVTGSYTDNKYGWTNLREADIVRVLDGYKLKLPRAKPLNI